MEINETLVDILFKNFKTQIKTTVSGDIIEFRVFATETKSIFSIKLRKNTFNSIFSWLENIKSEIL
jgi:hypothetical protein